MRGWSGVRKRLTILGVLVVLGAAGYAAWIARLKATHIRTFATVISVKRIREISPEASTTFQATIRYEQAPGRERTVTTAYRASYLDFKPGQKVPILLNPVDRSEYVLDTFVPTWGVCLILLGVGVFTLAIAPHV